jgi:hypothetical protein
MKSWIANIILTFAATIVLAVPGKAAPDKPICLGDTVTGWMTINFTNSASCPPAPGQANNAKTVRDLTSLPTGTTESVCLDGTPTPAGWVITAVTFVNACGGTAAANNVETIQFVTGVPPAFGIDVCSTTTIPIDWIVTSVSDFMQVCPSPTSPGNQWHIKSVSGEQYPTEETMCTGFTPVPDFFVTIGSPQPDRNCGSALGVTSQTIQSNILRITDIYCEVPITATTTAGTAVSYAINVGGIPGVATFSVSGLPAGANGTFSPVTIPGGTGSTTLTVSTSTSTPAGTYTLGITASGGGATVSNSTGLIVNGATVKLPAPPKPCVGKSCIDQP